STLTPSTFPSTDTAPTYIYTLSLHDALPIYYQRWTFSHVERFIEAGEDIRYVPRRQLIDVLLPGAGDFYLFDNRMAVVEQVEVRSEEHTSELQSRGHLVCRLLLEKKKKKLRK